jgi:hypothetical protein
MADRNDTLLWMGLPETSSETEEHLRGDDKTSSAIEAHFPPGRWVKIA